jgi:hypothetical protein
MSGYFKVAIKISAEKLLLTSTKTFSMTTVEIATRLVALSRTGKWAAAQKELYADGAVSHEPYPTPAFEKETKGLQAIIEKGEKWGKMVKETHKLEVSDPLIAGNSFAITMHMDLTMHERGPVSFTELCVYQVKDGKIISEQFFM